MLRNKKGMTLVEMIVSIAVLAIAVLILATGFSTVIRHIGDATLIKNTSDELFTSIESDSQENKTTKNANVTITLSNGNEINDTISLVTAKKGIDDSEDAYQISFSKFTKDGVYIDTTKTFYEQVKEAVQYCRNNNGWSSEYNEFKNELIKQGITPLTGESDLGNWFGNTNFNQYFYLMKMYPNFYPTLDSKVKEAYNQIVENEKKAGRGPFADNTKFKDEEDVYIKAIVFPIQGNDKIILTVDTSRNNYRLDRWKTKMIYIPEEDCWYARLFYNDSKDTADNVDHWLKNVAGLDDITEWNDLLTEIKLGTYWKKIVID